MGLFNNVTNLDNEMDTALDEHIGRASSSVFRPSDMSRSRDPGLPGWPRARSRCLHHPTKIY